MPSIEAPTQQISIYPPTYYALRHHAMEALGPYGETHAKTLAQERGIRIPTDLLGEFDLSLGRELIHDDGTVFVRNGTIKLARPYWEEVIVGANPEAQTAIDQIVDADSRLIFRIPDEEVERLLQQDALDAGIGLIDALGILYDNNRYPLHDSVIKQVEGKWRGLDGMNEHGRQHVETVLLGTYNLLQWARHFRTDINDRSLSVGTTAAAGHDVGQILLRDGQEVGSVRILEQVMPALVTHGDKDFWHDVKRAIIVHPEANMTHIINEVWKTQGNAAATIQRMYEELRPEELALILADKWHIGQDRLPSTWRESDGILRDLHVGINAAFDVEQAGYTADGKTFRVEMDYNPGLEQSYFAQVNGFTSPTEHPAVIGSSHYENGKFRMPEAIHKLLQDGKASHSEVLEALMWSKYGYKERLRLAIMSAFALVPQTDTVEITINDTQVDGLRGRDLKGKSYFSEERIAEIQKRTYKFSREDIDQQLDAIQAKLLAKGIVVDTLVEEGRKLLPEERPTRRSTTIPAA